MSLKKKVEGIEIVQKIRMAIGNSEQVKWWRLKSKIRAARNFLEKEALSSKNPEWVKIGETWISMESIGLTNIHFDIALATRSIRARMYELRRVPMEILELDVPQIKALKDELEKIEQL